MSVNRRWWIVVTATVFPVALVVAGCDGPESDSSHELAAMMRRDVDLSRPAVSGPRRDVLVEQEREKVLKAVRDTLREAGVTVLQAAKSGEGVWLFGQSLADRQVLLEIQPIVRGSFVIRITVEGADLVMSQLLEELTSNITRRTHGQPVRNW